MHPSLAAPRNPASTATDHAFRSATGERSTCCVFRQVAAGKTPNEAMRCLKRRLSDIVYRALIDDLTRHAVTGPGGHSGNDSDSSATGSQPMTGSSDKSLPGPAGTDPTTPNEDRLD